MTSEVRRASSLPASRPAVLPGCLHEAAARRSPCRLSTIVLCVWYLRCCYRRCCWAKQKQPKEKCNKPYYNTAVVPGGRYVVVALAVASMRAPTRYRGIHRACTYQLPGLAYSVRGSLCVQQQRCTACIVREGRNVDADTNIPRTPFFLTWYLSWTETAQAAIAAAVIAAAASMIYWAYYSGYFAVVAVRTVCTRCDLMRGRHQQQHQPRHQQKQQRAQAPQQPVSYILFIARAFSRISLRNARTATSV